MADAIEPEAQSLFIMVTSGGLNTPRRVPQGVPNAIAYFQDVMRDGLDELIESICLVWVDDIVIWGNTAEQLISPLELVLARLEERGLFVAAHRAVFHHGGIRWRV